VSEEVNAEFVDGLAELFRQSFPDVRCLRCGYADFYILPSERQTFIMGEKEARPTYLPVITLACIRCGHLEQHLSDPLRDAAKPIEIEKPGAPK